MIAPPDAEHLGRQIVWLLVLAIPIACIARTLAYEEVLREPRDWCRQKSQTCALILQRKFFYIFTCEYCVSHWVTLPFVLVTGFRLLIDDWRGYVISFFSLVLVANAYLNLYSRLRVDIAQAKVETKKAEQEVDEIDRDGNSEIRNQKPESNPNDEARTPQQFP